MNDQLLKDLEKLRSTLGWYDSHETSKGLVVKGARDELKAIIDKLKRGRYETEEPDPYQGLKDALVPKPVVLRVISSLTTIDEPSDDYSRHYNYNDSGPERDYRDDWDFDRDNRGGTY